MNDASLLVTGAAGFIGRHVARTCLAAGHRVVCVDQRAPPPDLSRAATVHVARCDDPVILDAVAAERFSAVLHLAGISSTLEEDWALLHASNVAAPTALEERCAATGTRFVYASSSSVYGRVSEHRPVNESDLATAACSGPLNAYARSKALFDERMAESSGEHWIGLRFTNVFGPGEGHKRKMASIISQMLRRTARQDTLTLFADTLEACRDYVPVATVAQTCLMLADCDVPVGVYNLGSGHAISFSEVLRWCAEFSGAPPSVELVPNPHREHYQYWTCADMSALDAALPARPRAAVNDVRCAARALYQSFRPAA